MIADWESDATQDASGIWTTTAPQDLFVCLNQQLDLAIKHELKGEPFLAIAHMCLDVLTEFQNLQMASLASQGVSCSDSFLVAVVNNSQQCSENCEEIKDLCKGHLDSHPHHQQGSTTTDQGVMEEEAEEKLEEEVEDCLIGFAKVGTTAIKAIAQQIINCLRDNVLPDMFTQTWLSAPDGEFGEKIIATLSDYFSDYESWIGNSFFFSKLIQDTMQLFIRLYCDCFLSSNINIKQKDLLAKLHADYEVLLDWYTGPHISTYVPGSVGQAQVGHIEKVQNIIDCEQEWVPLFFDSVYAVFGADRGVALKTLLSMRLDLSSSNLNELVGKYREKYKYTEAASPAQGQSRSKGKAMWRFRSPRR